MSMSRLDDIVESLKPQIPNMSEREKSRYEGLLEKQRAQRAQPALGSPASITQALTPPVASEPLPPGTSPIDLNDLDVQEEGGFSERLQASFFRSPDFKVKVLQDKFGKGNARVGATGEPEFRISPRYSFIPLDSEDFNLLDLVDMVGDIPEVLTQTVLEPLGAAAGAASPIPGGAFLGKTVASGAGQALGRLGTLGAQRLILGESEPFEPGAEFLTGAGTEALTTGLVGGVKKLFNPVANKLGVRRAADLARSKGIKLSAADATQDSAVGMVQNALDMVSFGGTGQRVSREAVEKFDRVVKKEVFDLFGKEIDDVTAGDLISRGIEDFISTKKAHANALYDDVFKAIPDATRVMIPPEFLQIAAVQVRDEIERSAVRDEGVNQFINRIANIDRQSLKELSQTRSDILSAVREFNGVFGSRGKRWMQKLSEAAGKDIDRFADFSKTHNVVAKLKEANRYYRDIMQVIKHPQVEKLFQKIGVDAIPAEKIPGRFIKKTTPTGIKKLKEVLSVGDWKELQGYVGNDILMQASNVTPGGDTMISPAKLITLLKKYKKGGALKEIFSSKQVEALENFSDIATLLQSAEKVAMGGNTSGTAGNVLRVGGLSGAAATLTGSPTAGGVMFLVAPFLGNILQAKPIVNYLSRGIKTPGKAVSIPLKLAARKAFLNLIQEVTGQNLARAVPSPGLEGL